MINQIERVAKMFAEVHETNLMLPELYDFLPRNDFYRLKQLLEEAEAILKKNKDGRP